MTQLILDELDRVGSLVLADLHEDPILAFDASAILYWILVYSEVDHWSSRVNYINDHFDRYRIEKGIDYLEGYHHDGVSILNRLHNFNTEASKRFADILHAVLVGPLERTLH